jgi:hypothetical protein
MGVSALQHVIGGSGRRIEISPEMDECPPSGRAPRGEPV